MLNGLRANKAHIASPVQRQTHLDAHHAATPLPKLLKERALRAQLS
jgi:hypothetical protein